jgi:hypothetical protein
VYRAGWGRSVRTGSVDPPGDIRWMLRGEPEDEPVDGLTTL